MVFSVDGNVHYTYNPTVQNDNTWPFDQDQFLLLNFAIEPNITPSFTEDTFEIDYVRVYQESSLSNEDVNAEQSLNISPNPTQNQVSVIKNNHGDHQMLKVYTIQGQLIKSYNLRNKRTSVNMEGWSPGVYLFKQVGDKQSKTYKVIKE
jgi:hypothetical protein